MALLTPEQIARLQAIIRDSSTALAITTTGYQVPSKELQRLVDEGYLDPTDLQDIVIDSFTLGQLMEKLEGVKQMPLPEFESYLKKNPVSLSQQERRAYDVARNRAGLFCVGLGNRYAGEFSQEMVAADEAYASELRGKIATKTAESIAARKTVKQLKSQLGKMAGDWSRDWDRIAVTETQLAHQEGFLEDLVGRYGDDELVAKIPEPNACKYCMKLYTENGKPLVKPASWWQDQGVSNVGRKQADWKAVLGAMHPHCACQLVRVPAGWEFSEDWDIVPKEETSKSAALQLTEGPPLSKAGQGALLERQIASPTLSKSRKLHKRIKFQGFDISIENRKGSVRHWEDKESGTEGQTKMHFDYGYIRLTEGVDGDHVDCFIGPNEDAQNVYVVKQMKLPDFKEFDENKCMIGFSSAKEAKAAYLMHFDRPEFFGSMTTMPLEVFRKKVYTMKRKMIKAASGQLQFNSEPIDEVLIWEKAIKAVGLNPDQFDLVVKYARKGHEEARKALDAVYAELEKGSQFGGGIAIGRSSPVGTMGQHSKPARTSGENVRSDKVGEPREDWPPMKKRGKRKRRKLPPVTERFDVKGLSSSYGGRDQKYKLDEVESIEPGTRSVDTKAVKEKLEVQQKERQKLRQGSKLVNLEIYR